MGISPPAPLTAEHLLVEFDCGVATLNEWLQRRALANEALGASRTFVVCDGRRVMGYYALATGSVRREEAPGRVKRRMPEPIPVMVLGRLAVDLRWQGKRIGQGLLKDAVLRTLNVSKKAGISAIVVHAISESAKAFYLSQGFVGSPLNPMTLMLSIVPIGREGM
jgi:predicted N-acetyltransferase YhbS